MSDSLDFAKRIYAVQWAVAALDRLDGSRASAPSSFVRAHSIVALLDEAIYQLQAIRAEVAPEIEPAQAPFAITNPADPAHAVVIQAAPSSQVDTDALRLLAWDGLKRLATDEALREKFNALSGEEAIALMGLKPPAGAAVAPAAGPAKRPGRKAKAAPEPEAPATASPQQPTPEPAQVTPDAPHVVLFGPNVPMEEPATPAGPEPPVAPSLPPNVSPDAARVLQETGDAFRAKAAADAEAHAKTQAEALATTKRPGLAERPEDVELPWKEGVYANKKLSECTVAELEHIVGQFVRGALNERDAERLPGRKLWVERSKAWHAYRLDEYVTQVAAEDRPQLIRHYEAVASMPTVIQPMHAERALWLARVRELSAT